MAITIDFLPKKEILILPNISLRKDNQIIKSEKLIEYNIKTFFLKNHTKTVVEKLVPELFLKNQN